MTYQATRYHDFSYGHRVVGHESKCRHLHGHNGRVHFTCQAAAGLDEVGRVVDFSVIKEKLCMWLEDNWDHRFLAWTHDSLIDSLFIANELNPVDDKILDESVVFVPFNPTAENMAAYLVQVIGPKVLEGTGVELVSVVFEETSKCSAEYHR